MFFISWFFTIFPTTSFKLNYYFTYAKNYQSLDYNDFNYNYWKKEVRLSRIGRRSTTRHRNYYQSYLGTYIQMRKKRSEGSVSSNWFFDNFENQFTVERNKVLNSFGESWQRQFPSYRRPTKSLIESVLYERRHRQLLIRSAILENLESRRWLHKKSFRKKKHKLYLEVFGKMYSEDLEIQTITLKVGNAS